MLKFNSVLQPLKIQMVNLYFTNRARKSHVGLDASYMFGQDDRIFVIEKLFELVLGTKVHVAQQAIWFFIQH